MTLGDTRVLVSAENDERWLADERDVDALIVAAREHDASWVVLRSVALPDDFFKLATGMAGRVVQKLINYQLKVAVVGNIASWLEQSTALRALTHESNRGDTLWFVADLNELERRFDATRKKAPCH
ncbi:DUF4180 domain-containing protein [Paraburkholderia sp. D15]|uniref:DUF4180 domain-containing protein n=1 Tax=Paraburkholderia sp. D15 TaxID=2880218 RepID=UPI00247A9633|nr:DUF4180 domain-containing protein [Paraburkholderia sp. D15]WGS54372.1 DUF4180 domain-containing protein [Paraburkholderia sp. D15]